MRSFLERQPRRRQYALCAAASLAIWLAALSMLPVTLGNMHGVAADAADVEPAAAPTERDAFFEDMPRPTARMAAAVAVPDALSAPEANRLWERVRQGYQLEWARDNRRVRAERNEYLKGAKALEDHFRRGIPYLHHILDALERRDMPTELLMLPMLESMFDPFARSHSGAVGLWQFMEATADRYGLRNDAWQDERRDLRRSTEAGIAYLEDLHDMFRGDWLLAIAAYNGGENAVAKAMRASARYGLSTNFWSLRLNAETQRYVPRLLALASLVQEPGRYGITLPYVPYAPYWGIADSGRQVDLAKVADLADMELEELLLLNASLKRWVTPPEGPHVLLLPRARLAVFQQRLAELPEDGYMMRWRPYTIRRNDTLARIARRHMTDIQMLRRVNELLDDHIRFGEQLLVPDIDRPIPEMVVRSIRRNPG